MVHCGKSCLTGTPSLFFFEKTGGANLTEWSGVWVYAEFRDGRIAPVAFELLGVGRKLADKRGVPLSAVLLGSGLDGNAAELVAFGADKVYQVDDPALLHFTDDAYANVIV